MSEREAEKRTGAATRGDVKGTGWLAARDYLVQVHGAECIEKIRRTLSPEDQALFAKPVLPISWLDYGAYMRFMLAADRLLGRGDTRLLSDASTFNAKKDLGGIYKFFISLTSPEFIINNAGRVWNQYYNRGRVIPEDVTKHRGIWRIVEWPEIPLHHETDSIPFAEECLRMSGAKNPVGRQTHCMARGDEYCRVVFTWE